MRLRSVRASFLSAAVMVGLASLASMQGCDPNQGEGERCSTTDDCSSGLICLSATVCCPQDARNSSSQDCRSLGGGTIVDAGGDGAVPDTFSPTDTNEAGATCSKGTSCVFNTDCNGCGLFCRGGHCNVECEGNRDCLSGSICDCTTFTCVAGTSGGSDDCRDAGVDSGVDTAPADTTLDDTGTGVDTTVDDTADATAG